MNRLLPSFVLFVLAIAANAQTTIELTDERFPIGWAGDDGWLVSRVVDDLTGAPIAGAEICFVDEGATPIGGEFWFRFAVATDAEGWFRVRFPDRKSVPYWCAIRHRSVGLTLRHDQEAIWRVNRPFDVPVRVLDWHGDPAPGALVGFCAGCGHTPDLANAVTDANGIAVLRGIDPQSGIRDLYVQCAGLGLGYEQVDWLPGDGPIEVRCAWSPSKSGTLLDHEGVPVAGAFVGALDVHRGPWAKTAADGTFTVLGAPPDVGTCNVQLADGKQFYFAVPTGYPAVLHLPERVGVEPQEGTVDSGPAAKEPTLRAIRFLVRGAPAAFEVDVAYAGGHREGVLDDADPDQGDIDVPNGPFVVELRTNGRAGGTRRFAFSDGDAVPDLLQLTWSPEPRIVGRAVDATGAPVPCLLTWSNDDHSVECDGGAFESTPPDDYRQSWRLTLTPNDEALLPRHVLVRMRSRDAESVPLGDIVLRREPELRVLDAAGKPLALPAVEWLRAGYQEVESHDSFALTEDGGWTGPDLQASDAIVVQLDENAAPFRTVLRGDGPWTITVPDAAIALEVVDADGSPLDACVVLGDQFVMLPRAAAIHGLPPGPLRCYIGVDGHRSAIVDTVAVAGTEPEAVRVVLPRR